MSNEIYSLFQSKKKENNSKLILIKNGDHFETYDEDAQIVAQEMNYTVSQVETDGKTIAQTSFPAGEIENVLKCLAEVSFETASKNKKRYVVLVVTETADGKPLEYFVPATAAESDTDNDSPDLTVDEATETAKADEKALQPNEVKAGDDKTLHVPTYEELKASELYLPIVDFDALTDNEIARAAQNKLSGEMDIRTFLYCWLHFTFRNNLGYAKQFLVKSKSLSNGIKYIEDHLKKASSVNSSVGIGESKVIELLLTYLRLDDAQIAAEKAKVEADRKARAAEKAKQVKKNKSASKTAKSSKTKSSETKDASKGKTTSKRSSAPKAATDESLISLFNMM